MYPNFPSALEVSSQFSPRNSPKPTPSLQVNWKVPIWMDTDTHHGRACQLQARPTSAAASGPTASDGKEVQSESSRLYPEPHSTGSSNF